MRGILIMMKNKSHSLIAFHILYITKCLVSNAILILSEIFKLNIYFLISWLSFKHIESCWKNAIYRVVALISVKWMKMTTKSTRFWKMNENIFLIFSVSLFSIFNINVILIIYLKRVWIFCSWDFWWILFGDWHFVLVGLDAK